ncbi:hypothetical protein XA68_12554 [Ophiocordyceps unilateralis]|uniref:Uncharacterized protein n=1 Tax=Ophiocordyceps unilateralis TaxID=268505 RepID=A0A2A9PP62_OPHUN|nr:hypothetical protein XA68_12554 [Ophiocordyceps unilateralis]
MKPVLTCVALLAATALAAPQPIKPLKPPSGRGSGSRTPERTRGTPKKSVAGGSRPEVDGSAIQNGVAMVRGEAAPGPGPHPSNSQSVGFTPLSQGAITAVKPAYDSNQLHKLIDEPSRDAYNRRKVKSEDEKNPVNQHSFEPGIVRLRGPAEKAWGHRDFGAGDSSVPVGGGTLGNMQQAGALLRDNTPKIGDSRARLEQTQIISGDQLRGKGTTSTQQSTTSSQKETTEHSTQKQRNEKLSAKNVPPLTHDTPPSYEAAQAQRPPSYEAAQAKKPSSGIVPQEAQGRPQGTAGQTTEGQRTSAESSSGKGAAKPSDKELTFPDVPTHDPGASPARTSSSSKTKSKVMDSV